MWSRSTHWLRIRQTPPKFPFKMGHTQLPPPAMRRRVRGALSSCSFLAWRRGNAQSGGSSLPYAALATSLAREGFVVVAPFHPGSKQSREALEDRPRQIHKALNATFADPRFATHADPNRLGMMGFSYGGAVALIVAGATPSRAHLAA